ncbi:MAG: beta-N-acetylhexosaminidase [Deltaproteobacteria bacterium]|nr:beta-N-acetylhexosaminidase [Deltaproteobacteria bacterium]
MFMVGLRGEEIAEEEKRLLKDYPFGGFVLFSHNLKEPKQILSLCRAIWEINKHLPPFIAVDHEGGRVHRLPPPFTHFPPAALLGRRHSPDLARRLGLAVARELAAVGINLNFAPVLDVHSNPDNPVIGDRSLSSDPKQVAALGCALIEGLRDGGVIPCGKHFPGHGDTSQDSHLELPVVEKSIAALKEVELLPFVHACRNQVESLMTAHVLYPSLDPVYPATLSEAVVGRLLREELGYQGVVFSDDLEMKAISKNYPLEEAVSRAAHAGVDALLFCHEIEAAMQAFEHLCRETEAEERLRERVEASYQRIKRLKERYLGSFRGAGEEELKNFIGTPLHRAIAGEIQGNL